jgi:hypothetical protein
LPAQLQQYELGGFFHFVELGITQNIMEINMEAGHLLKTEFSLTFDKQIYIISPLCKGKPVAQNI